MKKNKMYPIFAIALLVLFNNASCNDSTSDDDSGGGNPPAIDYLEITLKPSNINQTIHSFGASDAWSTQFLPTNCVLQAI